MTTTTTDTAPLKEIQKFVWTQGDFTKLARQTTSVGERLVDACGVRAGDAVLDVAAGTGNTAVSAARRGARVQAVDLAPAMVEVGRARCHEEGLDVAWQEADAEALPFGDGRFDHVLSTFGVMFAPTPEAAAAELFRVVRPQGAVGLASWTADSFVGRLQATVAGYMPPRPAGVPSPLEWGDEAIARARLERFGAAVEIERRVVTMTHPSPEAMWDFVQRHNGPVVAARMLLGERFEDLAGDVRGVIAELNEARDGSVAIASPYLLAVARPDARSAAASS